MEIKEYCEKRTSKHRPWAHWQELIARRRVAEAFSFDLMWLQHLRGWVTANGNIIITLRWLWWHFYVTGCGVMLQGKYQHSPTSAASFSAHFGVFRPPHRVFHTRWIFFPRSSCIYHCYYLLMMIIIVVCGKRRKVLLVFFAFYSISPFLHNAPHSPEKDARTQLSAGISEVNGEQNRARALKHVRWAPWTEWMRETIEQMEIFSFLLYLVARMSDDGGDGGDGSGLHSWYSTKSDVGRSKTQNLCARGSFGEPLA